MPSLSPHVFYILILYYIINLCFLMLNITQTCHMTRVYYKLYWINHMLRMCIDKCCKKGRIPLFLLVSVLSRLRFVNGIVRVVVSYCVIRYCLAVYSQYYLILCFHLYFQYSKWHKHFHRKNGLVKYALPMPLSISDGHGSETTVAIPINENTNILVSLKVVFWVKAISYTFFAHYVALPRLTQRAAIPLIGIMPPHFYVCPSHQCLDSVWSLFYLFLSCSVFRIQNDINTFIERMGWLNMHYLCHCQYQTGTDLKPLLLYL
jgi:hypothetical protein